MVANQRGLCTEHSLRKALVVKADETSSKERLLAMATAVEEMMPTEDGSKTRYDMILSACSLAGSVNTLMRE